MKAAPTTRSDEVLLAAAALFQQHGYSATTMSHIAEAVGVLPGSLYHHFASKEEIALHLMRDLHAALDALATSVTDSTDIRVFTREVVALSFSHAAAVRLSSYEPPTTASNVLREEMSQAPTALRQAWRTLVARHGTVTGTDAELLAYAFESLTLSASRHHDLTIDTTVDTIAAHLCDLLLVGVSEQPAPAADLDASTALARAKQAVASWPADDVPSDLTGEIIKAAREVFARRGFDATTIRDIASAAKAPMGGLYRRFESKQALLRRILEDYAASFDAALRAAMNSGDTEDRTLDALAYVFLAARRRFRQESDVLAFSGGGYEAEASPFHDFWLQTEERFELIASMLDRGQQAGRIRAFAPPVELANHLRHLFWVPYGDITDITVEQTLAFLRRTALAG